MRRVVITGMGAVCALGNNLVESLDAGLAGASGVRRCDERLWGRYGERLRARTGATVRGFDPTRHVPAKWVESYDPATVFSIAAAAEALDHSGVVMDEGLRERAGSVIGCAGPGVQTYHRALHAAFVEGAADRFPGGLLLQQSGNIYAGLIALRYGLRGPSLGLANACASGSAAIALAADMIRSGRADLMLAGGCEAPIGLNTYGSMVNAGSLAQSHQSLRRHQHACWRTIEVDMAIGEVKSDRFDRVESHVFIRLISGSRHKPSAWL